MVFGQFSLLFIWRLYWRKVGSLSGRLPSKNQMTFDMKEKDDTVWDPDINIYINSTFYSFEIKFGLSLLLFKMMLSRKLI